MVQTKSIFQSKTLWGGLMLMLIFALKTFWDIDVGEDETAGVVDALSGTDYALMASSVVAFILLVVGRFKARTPVSLTGRAKPSAMWFLGAMALPALLLTGCARTAPLVNAADQYLNTCGDEYLGYVEADELLTEDDKSIRRLHHNTFRRAVDEAKTNLDTGSF